MLYYNPAAFNKLLFQNSPLRDDYNVMFLNRASIGKFDRSGLFTKFNTNNEQFNMKSIFELPKYDSTYRLNFEETCFKRTQELISEHNQMNIWWSGGLDSTVVLLAFHQHFKTIHQNIKIVLTEASIEDSPQIYEDIVKQYDHVVLKKFADRKPHFSLEYPNVTGDCSEGVYGWSGLFQLFIERYGMDIAYYKIDDISKLKNKMTESDFNDFNYFLKLNNIMCETYEASPIKIETLIDMNWWFVYNFCWQYDYLRFQVPLYQNYEKAFKYTEPFFAHEGFENWIVNNYDKVINRIPSVKEYKIDEINFIKKYYPGIIFTNILPRKTNVDIIDLAPKGFLLIDDNYELVSCPKRFDTNIDEMRMMFNDDYSEEQIKLLFD